MSRALNAAATSTPEYRRRCIIATTSEITVMFLPGLSGTITRGSAHVEDDGLLLREAGAVGVLGGVPRLELHDDLDALLLPHRARAEERRDVDEPDAADFHVMRRELVTAADEDVVAAAGHLHHVVRDEAVASLDQVEHALALPDSRPADEEQPDAVHVRERAVQRGARRERLFDDRLDPPVEFRRLELAAEHRHAPGAGELEQLGRNLLPLRDEDAGQLEAEEFLERGLRAARA